MWLNLVTAHLWGNALRAAAAVDRVWMFAAALVWILGLRSQVTKERKLLSWVISQVRPQKAPEAPDKPRAGTTLFWMEPAPPLQKRKVVREDAFYARRMCCRNRTAARYRTKYREGRTDLPRTPTIILEDLGVKNSSVRVFDSSGPPGYVTGDLIVVQRPDQSSSSAVVTPGFVVLSAVLMYLVLKAALASKRSRRR